MGVDRERIVRDFQEIARQGALEHGGVTRLAFTEVDRRARTYLRRRMEEAGLEVRVDALGNMRGLRRGQIDLPPVLIGSHLDTVPEGGHFDGVVGVIAALEVVRALNDLGITTRRPIEVVNFSAEESSRFGVATLGSKALVGRVEEGDLDRLVDADGVTLRQALHEAGCHPEGLSSCRDLPGTIHAFLELHIEQGPVLDLENCPVGIVTAIAAPTRFRVTVTGRADHSGTTPMTMRQDALAGASELILGVERIASHEAGADTVGTVGYLRVAPGVMNVVPGHVELGIDLRDIDSQDKREAANKVVALMSEIARRRRLDIAWETLCDDEPVMLSPKVIDLLTTAARAQGIRYRTLHSGAGHDAMNMASIADAGMIFVPSVDGISHNIAEKSDMDDICRGTELLLQAAMSLAQEG